MISKQLIEYIQQRIAESGNTTDITKELLVVGWNINDINEAFNTLGVSTEEQTQQNQTSTLESSKQIRKNFYDAHIQADNVKYRDSFWYRPAIIITAFIVLAIIISGSVYAYYIFSKQPSAIIVLRNAVIKIPSVQAFNISATSTYDINASIKQAGLLLGTTTPTNATTTTIINTHGAVDINGIGNHPNFDIITAIKSNFTIATTTGLYSFTARTIFSPNAFDANLLHGNVSVTSSQNPQMRFGVMAINSAITSFSNKWIQLINLKNASSSQQIINLFSTFSPHSSSFIGQDIKGLLTYVQNLQYIRSIKNIGIEYINGIPTYHLSLVIQNTSAFVPLMQKTLFDISQHLRQQVSKIKTGALSTVLDNTSSYGEFIQNTKWLNTALTQKIPVDIWVGKKDSYIYRIVIPHIKITSINFDKNTAYITAQYRISFSHYNYIQPILAPRNSETLQSFIRNLFGGSFTQINPGNGNFGNSVNSTKNNSF